MVGRPLADIVFYVVNYGHPSFAVSPLYTLLSVFIYSLSGLLMVRAYGHRTPLWSALAVLPLFVQPYGLENLSYGFDSVFMSLSVALAIVAAILVQMSATGLSLVGGFLLLEASLCMYQPGTSGFIPVAGFLIIGSQLRLLVGDLASLPSCNSLKAYCRSEYQLFRLNMDTLVIKILPIRNPPKHE